MGATQVRRRNNRSSRTREGEGNTSSRRPPNQSQTSNTVRRTRERRYHRCAINYHERKGIPVSQLAPPRSCPHCQAKLFHHETSELCCQSGKVKLPAFNVPEELLSLYTDQTPTALHFRNNIRKYNHLFSFMSMGVHLDDSLANYERGVYTFRAQGGIYHKIGGFLPSNNDDRPRFLQLYIYDTDHELEHRLSENNTLQEGIIERLKGILDGCNPFVHEFRHLGRREDLEHCKLVIREQPSDQRQYCLPSASQVAGIISGGEEIANLNDRDIVVQSRTGELINIADTAGYYNPMQYPLLLPFGSYGWLINSTTNDGNKISCRAFYSYILQIHPNDQSVFLRAERLLQQFAVDNFVKIEAHKLRWIRDNQNTIRADLYRGVQDCYTAGELDPENVGKKYFLPSSFYTSPRDMNHRFLDGMTLVENFGKPDLFITKTCNPYCKELTDKLLPGQKPQDRPDLVARIFHAKLEEFLKDVVKRGVLGKVVAYQWVVEFQKRGLPYVHMLVMLDQNDRPRNPDEYDQFVRAEIPDKDEEPELYKAVLKHMIHGPFRIGNRVASCMENGVCKRKFLKSFSDVTVQGQNSYPTYRRPQLPPVPLRENATTMVDNRWVVPYNSWLLLKYDCHINIEICCSIKGVKYLYKYVGKIPDLLSMEIRGGREYNEIKDFLDARWVCTPEAFWRLYKFPLTRMYPSVERLQLHLKDMHQIRYSVDQPIADILSNPRNRHTMLTEFFKINASDPEAQAGNYLYREFLEHYHWVSGSNTWRKRCSNLRVVGRIYNASPLEGERFFLRTLLNHVRCPKSFEDLRTVNGVTYATFREAVEKLGLMDNDDTLRECLAKVCNTKMPSAIRRLFVTILAYCQPTGVRSLWEEFYPFMVDDYSAYEASPNCEFLMNCVICEIRRLLQQLGKTIEEFDLPNATVEVDDDMEANRCILDELSAPIPPVDIHCAEYLNSDQRYAFDRIMDAIDHKTSGVFFIDGPSGTGKTFLYRAILATVKLRGQFALAAASSGIAATLLYREKTAHKTFGLPVSLNASSVSTISKQCSQAQLIKHASVIIWDEATMTRRYAFEAVDRSLRDIWEWNYHLEVIHLTQNMRSRQDEDFAAFLLRLGDGQEPTVNEDMIKLPSTICLPTDSDSPIDALVDAIFPNISDHACDVSYMVSRAIVTPTNDDVNVINDKILQKFAGTEKVYFSYDYVPDDRHHLYPTNFLNSLHFGGLPPHSLKLKVGSPIMLLRNIDPKNGLCNGTRLICVRLGENIIEAEILTGHCKGTIVFIPRIPLKTAEDVRLPFEMVRKQFPVKLCFALTINKAQGQTIPHVGVYLPEHVFSHGQFYVSLSRGTSQHTTKVLVMKGQLQGKVGEFTRNVVYKEVFNHNRFLGMLSTFEST